MTHYLSPCGSVKKDFRSRSFHMILNPIQGKNVDPGFRMRVRMTQLPRLPSPASAEFRNFVSKIQAYRPESGQVEATEWNCYT